MNPSSRSLFKVSLVGEELTALDTIERLMGKKPEHRFKFIQEQMLIKGEEVLDSLDL